jgi:hypothetical protein
MRASRDLVSFRRRVTGCRLLAAGSNPLAAAFSSDTVRVAVTRIPALKPILVPECAYFLDLT